MLKPATNVIFCFVGGFISALLLHWAKAVGYQVSDDVELALPASITAAVAYLHDVASQYLASRLPKKKP